ncbi:MULTISPECIES: complex I NDUFA9 subunit family protein [unclassified Sphingomonas]|jgi:NADH dehydrogenase|uniref:complex I NDUFA9 subunit family protein n=1 Tax=unclassified Sphingomonas TaxID=196159 RepID=UPI001F55B3D1|nr:MULTISPECIES: complex I NDUFA9 subunit family protein [unclassified Sphingomonas]
MKNKLVTVIGGGGFLGRYVAQALLKREVRLRVAQRDPRAAWFLKPLGTFGNVQFVGADVTKPETIAHAIAGSDAVVNLVGILSGNFSKVHVEGARVVAEAARAAGVQTLVHVSAIGADANSDSAYGRSKGEGEAAVRAAFPQATILRPSVVFGREDAFLNRFASMIASTRFVPVLRAQTRFQPVFVGDVADAVAVAIADPELAAGKTIELGGPDVMTMGALMRWIALAIGRKPTFLELPDAIGSLIAMGGALPGAPITQDQWKMLQHDNVVSSGAAGFADLGISPTPLASVAPTWLVSYRRNGRFGARAAA